MTGVMMRDQSQEIRSELGSQPEGGSLMGN
jgi:hypothetical protein